MSEIQQIKPDNSIYTKKNELVQVRNPRINRLVPYIEAPSEKLQVGDLVLLRREIELSGPKLRSWLWAEPYEIMRKTHPNYMLKSSNGEYTRNPVHICR